MRCSPDSPASETGYVPAQRKTGAQQAEFSSYAEADLETNSDTVCLSRAQAGPSSKAPPTGNCSSSWQFPRIALRLRPSRRRGGRRARRVRMPWRVQPAFSSPAPRLPLSRDHVRWRARPLSPLPPLRRNATTADGGVEPAPGPKSPRTGGESESRGRTRESGRTERQAKLHTFGWLQVVLHCPQFKSRTAALGVCPPTTLQRITPQPTHG